MSMMVFKTDSPEDCGIVELDKNKILISMHEKVRNPSSNLANGAVYILSKELLNEIKKNFMDSKNFTFDIVLNLLGKIYCYETQAVFFDIGTKERYKKANFNFFSIQFFSIQFFSIQFF